MGGVMSVYLSLNTSKITFYLNKFLNNSADFGSALNLEHRGAIVEIIENLFEYQSIPKHIIGNGVCIKSTGFGDTHTLSMRNIFKNTFSLSIGAITLFGSSLRDINSTYISRKFSLTFFIFNR